MHKSRLATFAIGAALCCAGASCHNNGTHSRLIREHFIETQFVDSSVKPGDDFYRFANGKWSDTAKIPPDYPVAGSGLDVHRGIQQKLKTLLEDASKNGAGAGSIEQKVGDFYTSGMDTVLINNRGYEPVNPLLAQIDAITDIPSLMKLVAAEEKNGNQTLIGFSVDADQGNSRMNIGLLLQAGIGLPERDYYFRTDSATVAVQNAYKNYLSTLFRLTGTDSINAVKNTGTVYQVEKDMAASHKTAVELRNVKANYNKVAFAKIDKEQPNIGWTAFFRNIGGRADSVDMEQAGYYTRLNTLLQTVSIPNWKLYLRAHILKNYAGYLSQPFQDAAFSYRKDLTGQQVQQARWERICGVTDKKLGEALGQLYVKKYFPPEARQRMDVLIDNLIEAFAARIQKLDWMSDSTKIVAAEKLKAIRRKIGYPDKWRDYSRVHIDRSKYFENIVAASRNNFDFQLSQLGRQVDESLWFMTPPTLNAYYDPTRNDINFPAGILQFPFFDKDADDAMNYGGIGAVIGHEITHGFDDQGAQYDKTGNIHDWWTKQDKAKFDEKVKQIQQLYDGFVVLDSLHLNGKLTSGENIADFGGIAIAYDAFKMTQQGQTDSKIDGFTSDQRFFLAYAQAWRSKYTDAIMRMLVHTDPHSTPDWRVLGPLMNFEPFYKAFSVQPGNRMYREPKDRIKIW
ncbi:M13 family metallopeptidase [Niabella drilacis]|uniref:Putative endopeptidase n=1 Tax=Niabella drilacis (strain DSM 25811 / CCM 8410 / CCUG 62505 / LMG 26954 / E90) TaxID=1285928 RepID=A0A1G6RAM8_NIADE|nr:M13 family metallopeptidase [Niabella drilacis]SDD01680.1 putative endopeptidase [Niabella drilacis]